MARAKYIVYLHFVYKSIDILLVDESHNRLADGLRDRLQFEDSFQCESFQEKKNTQRQQRKIYTSLLF